MHLVGDMLLGEGVIVVGAAVDGSSVVGIHEEGGAVGNAWTVGPVLGAAVEPERAKSVGAGIEVGMEESCPPAA